MNMNGCLSVLALQWAGDHATVYPASHLTSGRGSSPPHDPELDNWLNMYMNRYIFIGNIVLFLLLLYLKNMTVYV